MVLAHSFLLVLTLLSVTSLALQLRLTSLFLPLVELLVSSSPPSQKCSLSDEVTLNCEVWGGTEVSMDWHLQKDGTGHGINLEDSRITIQQGTQEEEASSLTIRQLSVHDEGTYICVVTSGKHRVQQILQLKIRGKLVYIADNRGEIYMTPNIQLFMIL